MIALVENVKELQSPEDISEISNHIFSLYELGYTTAQIDLLSSCITGYAFSTSTKQHYCIITLYLGWAFVTIYQPKRYVHISLDNIQFAKNIADIVREEINFTFENLAQKNTTLQKQLDETGLREKIKKRYLNQ